MVADVDVTVDGDDNQGEQGGAEGHASDERVGQAVGHVENGVAPAAEVDEPEGHDVHGDEQVGQGQVADVEAVQGAQGGLTQQGADDQHVAQHAIDAGHTAKGQH